MSLNNSRSPSSASLIRNIGVIRGLPVARLSDCSNSPRNLGPDFVWYMSERPELISQGLAKAEQERKL